MMPEKIDLSSLKGQVVLITGAGRGLGRVLAREFAKAGALVAANDITPNNLDETMLQINAAHGKARSYVVDISKEMSACALVEQVCEDFSRIDVLINNAAVQPHAPLLNMDSWEWQRTLDVNLSGPFWLMKIAVARMKTQGGGVILNIASGEQPNHPPEDRGAFFASKAGLLALTRAAAEELMTYNICIHAICPSAPTGEKDSLSNGIAKLSMYLCSVNAATITGQVFQLDHL